MVLVALAELAVKVAHSRAPNHQVQVQDSLVMARVELLAENRSLMVERVEPEETLAVSVAVVQQQAWVLVAVAVATQVAVAQVEVQAGAVAVAVARTASQRHKLTPFRPLEVTARF